MMENNVETINTCHQYDVMINNVTNIIKSMNFYNKMCIDSKYLGLSFEQYVFKKFRKVKIINCYSNSELGNNIIDNLGIKSVDCDLGFFSDNSPNVVIKENIRNSHIFILQTGSNIKHSINDYLEQLLAIIDACKRSGSKTITTIIPYYPNSRSDKREFSHVPIMAKTTTQILENVGVDRIITFDLHSGQIQGFGNKQIENLYAKPLIVSYLQNMLFNKMTNEIINQNYVLVSPDAGGYKRVYSYSETLNINNVIMHKERDYTIPNHVNKSVIVGQIIVTNKICILLDDMIDTAGTLISSVNELITAGAKEVIPIATHGVFSGLAIDRINSCPYINRVIVTNTLPQTQNKSKCTKDLIVLDLSSIISKAIIGIIFGENIIDR